MAVVIVTGACAGVGRATVRAFAARRAASLVLIAWGRDGLEAAARAVEPAGRDDQDDNLFAPRPGDHGAHGRFDRQSRTSGWQLTASLVTGTVWSRPASRGTEAA